MNVSTSPLRRPVLGRRFVMGALILVGVLLMPLPAAALDAYTCRYFGADYAIGQRICMKTPTGLRWTSCVMELNNSSWKPAPDVCTPAEPKKPRTTSKAEDYVREYLGLPPSR